jgi:ribosomal protein S18 acetylase RimI-like enzyme
LRTTFPELPAEAEAAGPAEAILAAALERTASSGWGAFDGAQMVAYLIGEPVLDPWWGRSGWIRAGGSAARDTGAADMFADLYARLGQEWIRSGIFAHFVVVPASEGEILSAWFGLSFGIEHVHAVLDLEALPSAESLPLPGVSFRLATAEDKVVLAEMSDVVWRHQVGAPVWGAMLPEHVEPNRAGWVELLDDPTADVWLALEEGDVVGTQAYYPSEMTGVHLLAGAATCHLAIAGTRAEARGRGIATALTRTGLAHARQRGYRFCETDWRSTNLLSSRFWPRIGFRPAFDRLVRRIDERIAWAKGDA